MSLFAVFHLLLASVAACTPGRDTTFDHLPESKSVPYRDSEQSLLGEALLGAVGSGEPLL